MKKLNKIIIDNNLQPIRDISNKFLQTAMSGGNTENKDNDVDNVLNAINEMLGASKAAHDNNEAKKA